MRGVLTRLGHMNEMKTHGQSNDLAATDAPRILHMSSFQGCENAMWVKLYGNCCRPTSVRTSIVPAQL